MTRRRMRAWPMVLAGLLLAAFVLLPSLAVPVRAQSTELIVDILTTPQNYWNKTVLIKGHVMSVTADPPGTSRGYYIFRDSSDRDIKVFTGELPSVGKEYTLVGVVEQLAPTDPVPCMRESNRRVGHAPAAAAPPPAAPADEPATRKAKAAPVATPAPNPPAPAPNPPAPTPNPPAPAPAPQAKEGLNTTLLYALVAVVGILSVVLIVAFWPRRVVESTPAPMPVIRVEPPAALPAGARTVASAPPPAPVGGMATRVVPPDHVSAATELYVDLGAELVITDGPDRGRHFPLTKPRIGIGRPGARKNEVALTDDTVSREHAKIIFNNADKTFRLINESNTNPVKVNGSPVDDVVLHDNDVIRMGATSMKFVKTVGAGA